MIRWEDIHDSVGGLLNKADDSVGGMENMIRREDMNDSVGRLTLDALHVTCDSSNIMKNNSYFEDICTLTLLYVKCMLGRTRNA